MTSNLYAGRTLAFLGDAVWSLVVRENLIAMGYTKANQLQQLSIGYVSAKAQAYFYERLHEEQFFSEQEEELFKRGRNSNVGSTPKNTEVQIYRISTGFEALVGALYLDQKHERINELWNRAVKLKEEYNGTNHVW